MSTAPSSLQSRFKSQANPPIGLQATDPTELEAPQESRKRTADDDGGVVQADSGALAVDTAPRLKKKAKKPARVLSFLDDDQDESIGGLKQKTKPRNDVKDIDNDADDDDASTPKSSRLTSNASVAIKPRALTKAAIQREAEEREVLREKFLALQAAVKSTEIAIPFVFYDGSNTAGGTACVKKGDQIWIFLDKARKMAAEMGGSSNKIAATRRQWARIGVDDLLLVKGKMIIPHHYDFYFFVMNKSLGPDKTRIFDYSADAPNGAISDDDAGGIHVAVPATQSVDLLEGARDNPTFTKVVDRRWYERNKHIFPASTWQAFDPEKDYQAEVKRDTGGNTFFYSK